MLTVGIGLCLGFLSCMQVFITGPVFLKGCYLCWFSIFLLLLRSFFTKTTHYAQVLCWNLSTFGNIWLHWVLNLTVGQLSSSCHRSKLASVRLHNYWNKICEDEKRSRQRNEQLLREFDDLETKAHEIDQRIARLSAVKVSTAVHLCIYFYTLVIRPCLDYYLSDIKCSSRVVLSTALMTSISNRVSKEEANSIYVL